MSTQPPSIATREELLRRISERATPKVEQHLIPSGPDADTVRRLSVEDNEKRIAVLQSTLDKAHERLETGHSFARLDGHARADFGRSR